MLLFQVIQPRILSHGTCAANVCTVRYFHLFTGLEISSKYVSPIEQYITLNMQLPELEGYCSANSFHYVIFCYTLFGSQIS